MIRALWLWLLLTTMACVQQDAAPQGPSVEELLVSVSDDTRQSIEQLRSGDPDLQLQAVEYLAKQDDPHVLTILLAMARDPDEDAMMRMDIMAAIGAMGNREATGPLVDMLKRDMEERRGYWSALIPALGNLGDPEAVPILVEALELQDEDWLGRTAAARALGQIGSAEAVPPLKTAFYLPETRSEAIAALAAIGDARAAEILVQAIDETEEPETISIARRGLVGLGKAAVPAIEDIVLQPASTEYRNTWQRKVLVQITADIGGPEADRLLTTLRQDDDPAIAAEAQNALASRETRDTKTSDGR